MSTEFDLILVPQVTELLSRVGTLLSFKYPTADAYDATTGGVTGTGDTTKQWLATPPWPYDHKMMEGTVGDAGEMMLWFAAEGLTFNPEVKGLYVVVDGVEWVVVGRKKVKSGDDVCAWGLSLNR